MAKKVEFYLRSPVSKKARFGAHRTLKTALSSSMIEQYRSMSTL
jgi:hypothetical protein